MEHLGSDFKGYLLSTCCRYLVKVDYGMPLLLCVSFTLLLIKDLSACCLTDRCLQVFVFSDCTTPLPDPRASTVPIFPPPHTPTHRPAPHSARGPSPQLGDEDGMGGYSIVIEMSSPRGLKAELKQSICSWAA